MYNSHAKLNAFKWRIQRDFSFDAWYFYCAHKVLTMKEIGPGKWNQSLPKDFLLLVQSASHSSHPEIHFIASILFCFVFMVMIIVGLFTEMIWW